MVGLSRIVSEINGDFARNSPIFPTRRISLWDFVTEVELKNWDDAPTRSKWRYVHSFR